MKKIEEQFSRLTQAEVPSVRARLCLLKRLREEIIHSHSTICEAVSRDTDKSPYEAYLTEVFPVISEIRHFVRHLRRWLRPRRYANNLFHFGACARTILEPKGIVLIYAPWNYPFNLLLMPLIAAIAAGNRVLLSPSPKAPATGSVAAAILRKAGLQPYVEVADSPVEERELLLRLPFQHIFYTGNPSFARTVAAEAGKRLIPLTLELGGKSPCIVMPAAHLKQAARRIVWGKLLNGGQTCVAPDYLLLHRSLAETFIPLLKEEIQRFLNERSEGRSATFRLMNREKVEWLRSAIAHPKGEIVAGGAVSPERQEMEPTLLLLHAPDHPLMEEELFAPVLPIILIDRLEEAAGIIGSHPSPLALYYFGDKEGFRKTVGTVPSGSASLNDCVLQISHPNLPFGGTSCSGMGAYHGRKGLETFSHAKSVYRAALTADTPLRYRLGQPLARLTRGLCGWLMRNL